MERALKRWALFSGLLTPGAAALFLGSRYRLFLTLAITAGTVFYHTGVRLLIGCMFDRFLNNQTNLERKWYQVSPAERALYQKLRVRQWKSALPTYDASLFDPALHSWREIAQAMCQAELIHEVNMAVSFLPLLFSIWFGAFPVFLATSVLASGYDLLFVILQRCNRPRVLHLIARESRRSTQKERILQNEKM